LGDTESGIDRLHCATLQYTACTSRHRHSNYAVITSPAHDRQPRHYWDIRQVVNGHKPTDGGSDIATLVRRALVEVRTVPVLLVFTHFEIFITNYNYDDTVNIQIVNFNSNFTHRQR